VLDRDEPVQDRMASSLARTSGNGAFRRGVRRVTDAAGWPWLGIWTEWEAAGDSRYAPHRR